MDSRPSKGGIGLKITRDAKVGSYQKDQLDREERDFCIPGAAEKGGRKVIPLTDRQRRELGKGLFLNSE